MWYCRGSNPHLTGPYATALPPRQINLFKIGSIWAMNAPIITEKYQTVIETITVGDVDNEVIVDCTPTFMCITFANDNAFFKRDQIGKALNLSHLRQEN